MKPKLNSSVWIVGDGEIYTEIVGWLGSASFIIKDYGIKIEPQFNYDDYGKTWVKTLKEAKSILQKQLRPNEKIVKLGGEWYEIGVGK